MYRMTFLKQALIEKARFGASKIEHRMHEEKVQLSTPVERFDSCYSKRKTDCKLYPHAF